MKRQVCSKLTIALGLSLIGFSSFSAQTIYGLREASQFRLNSSSDFYIQVGSFKSKSNASRLRQSLQKQSKSHPVLLRERSSYYVVLIGPIHSVAAARAAAKEFSTGPAVVRVVHAVPEEHKIIARSKPAVILSSKQGKLIHKAPIVSIYDKDGFILPSNNNKWFAGLGVGWMFPFGTNATNFASSGMPGLPDDRYAGDSSKSSGQYSALAGYQWRRNTGLPAYSLSLQYTYTSSAGINGFIFVNDLPDAKNFTYKYKISQQLAMVKFKADIYRWWQLMPYVSAGAGVAFNHVYGYSDSPIPGETLMRRRYGFTPSTRTQFTGTVGVGLDYLLSDKGQLSLGYELGYYGKVSTGNGQGVLSANRLENRLNSNAVILQGLYFFDWF